jgi:outer membrane protein assembly factor BamA
VSAATPPSKRSEFKRLWATGFRRLVDRDERLRVRERAIGKLVVYRMEERQRIKLVNYEGAKHLEQSKLEEKLRELDLMIRIDTFVDQTRVKRVKTVIGKCWRLGFPKPP